jgi:hypothetical protein
MARPAASKSATEVSVGVLTSASTLLGKSSTKDGTCPFEVRPASLLPKESVSGSMPAPAYSSQPRSKTEEAAEEEIADQLQGLIQYVVGAIGDDHSRG